MSLKRIEAIKLLGSAFGALLITPNLGEAAVDQAPQRTPQQQQDDSRVIISESESSYGDLVVYSTENLPAYKARVPVRLTPEGYMASYTFVYTGGEPITLVSARLSIGRHVGEAMRLDTPATLVKNGDSLQVTFNRTYR